MHGMCDSQKEGIGVIWDYEDPGSCRNGQARNKRAGMMNGLACQAKIVTSEEKVLWYMLRKIDLLD